MVSPSFCKKLLEASQTTFKSSHILKQFSLFGEVVKKMEEARMLMLSASSAAISVQLRPCEWTCTSDGRSITAGQGRQARDFSLNMKHSLHHDGNILRGFSCVRWALRDFTFRPLITFKVFKKHVSTFLGQMWRVLFCFNRLNSQLLIMQVKNLKAKKKKLWTYTKWFWESQSFLSHFISLLLKLQFINKSKK